MWSGIWSVATTRIGFWTWIWSTIHCGLGLEVARWFQCWKNSTSFDWSDNTGAIDVKMNGSVLEENSSFKMLELTFSSKLDWGSYIAYIDKVPPRKLEPWFVLWSFFLLRLLCISINLPYAHVWNTVVMSGLVLLVATWNCWISYKNRYTGLLVLHLLPFLNHWFIFKR